MARPLRIEAPGLWHHVMNRGLARQAVFVDEEDRHGFLALLVVASERWGLRTHAACLMDNHFHLLVQDGHGSLSRALRHVLGVYTQRFNRRHGRDGPLFRGRYRSRLVQDDQHLAEIVRYIHMNPVQAGMVAQAGDYPWSSHRHYLAGQAPDWLDTTEIAGRFGLDGKTIDTFVHARIPAAQRADLSWADYPAVLGDDDFVARWRQYLRAERPQPRYDVGEERRWLAHSCQDVLDAVCRHFCVSHEEVLTGGRGRSNLARQVALLLCVDHTPHDARDVASSLHAHAPSIPALASRSRVRAQRDSAFKRHCDSVLESLASPSIEAPDHT